MADRKTPMMQIADRILGGQISNLEEAVQVFGEMAFVEAQNNGLLQERLAELELSLDDTGWTKLDSTDDKQFTRAALKTINRTARLYWLKNPLIKRAVYTQTAYVFGQGMNIKATDQDVQEVVDKFMKDPKNQTELTSHQARMMKETELQLLANVFFVFFVNESTGEVRIRTIPDDEIHEIVYNPEDRKEPWYYLRRWKAPRTAGSSDLAEHTVLYRDYRYNPKVPVSSVNIDGKPVKVVKEQVYHIKVNALSDMDFGVSEVYAAIDWARAYKEFLEDWATLVKSLSRFAWKATSKTGAKGVDAAKQRFGSTISAQNPVEGNNPPATGSVLIHGQGLDVTPIAKSGTTTSVEDGRRMLLMVSAATGIFEHYFGDPSTGNLATATAMERPMELMFRDRQQLWSDIHVDIVEYIVEQSIIAANGPIKGKVDYNDYGERVVTPVEGTDTSVEVVFPDILERDVKAKIDAIVKAATLGGTEGPAGTLDLPLVTRMLLTALGVNDADAIIERLFKDKEELSWDEIEEQNTEKAIKAQQVMAKHGLVPGVPTDGDEDTSGKSPFASGDEDDSREAQTPVTPTDGFLRAVRRLDEQLAEMLSQED